MSPFTAIPSTDVDVDSPVDATLMSAIKGNLDYFNSLIGTMDAMDVNNGSFEIDSDSDGIPDTWTRSLYSGGSSALITAPTGGHGAKSFQFTQPAGVSQGGGDLTSDYIPIFRKTSIPLGFQCSTSNGTVIAKVIIKCYDAAKAAAGADQTIYTSSGTESLDFQRIAFFIPNTGTHFIKIKLVGGEVGPNTSATVVFDNISLRPHIMRLQMDSVTLAEQTETSTTYVDNGDLVVAVAQKIYNANLIFVFVAELHSNTTTEDAFMQFKIGSSYSNEMYVEDDKYATGAFILVHDPAGADTFTIDMMLKTDAGGGTAYGKKPFGPILMFVEDKSS
jgi:hypothetical protein